VHEALRSPGQPLDPATRAVMEPRFGHDFSHIKVHTDARAADSASAVNALAYTVGQDVVFGRGEYRPATGEGQRLIAHELTHTIQQESWASLQESGPSVSGLEGEAEAASHAAVEGRDVRVASGAALGLSRQPAPGAAPNPAKGAAPAPTAGADPNTIDGFVTGRADISPANMAKLQTIATRIQASLKDHPDSKVRVVGHTDAQGNEGNNMALGMRRAESTRDALVKMGVPAKNLETESKGQSEPVDDSGKKDSPPNRRVEVKIDAAAPTAPPGPWHFDPLSDVPKKQGLPPLIPAVPPEPQRPLGPRNPTLPPDFWKPLPPAPKGTQPKSALDVLNQKIVDPVVKAVTKGLPKDVQDKALELARAAVVKGITSGVGSALGAWGVDPKGQAAIQNAVEAAIKEKGQSTPGGSQ
jgi:outer membrane protein OmpA-like peptidoglycan-associated protein